MWADSQSEDFISTGSDQFLVRAQGGMVLARFSQINDPLDNQLRVNGTVRVDQWGVAGGNVLCWNSLRQLSICSSSARYKDDISALDLGLDTVLALQPVSYNWTSDGSKDIGFVAEEVAAIDERLITRNASGEVEGVRYDRISAVLANAAQTMHASNQRNDAELQVMETELESLQVENTSLRDRLAELETQQTSELDTMRDELAMLRELIAPRVALDTP